MNENDVIIDVKDLHKNYGQTEVIKGVDMTVRKGEVICIIGPSGAGKSTILRCLNGLEQATGGKIVVNGHDLTDSHVNIDQVREQAGHGVPAFQPVQQHERDRQHHPRTETGAS